MTPFSFAEAQPAQAPVDKLINYCLYINSRFPTALYHYYATYPPHFRESVAKALLSHSLVVPFTLLNSFL